MQNWVLNAEKKSASYNGLISDHNSTWCTKFKVKGAYVQMLKEVQKKLEDALSRLELPAINQIEEKKKSVSKAKEVLKKEFISVNVDYDSKVENKDLDFEDETVKDRWSRNIGVMGLDALKKQASSSILLFNLGGIGVEIAKNIILSGVKQFTVADAKNTQYSDLAS